MFIRTSKYYKQIRDIKLKTPTNTNRFNKSVSRSPCCTYGYFNQGEVTKWLW